MQAGIPSTCVSLHVYANLVANGGRVTSYGYHDRHVPDVPQWPEPVAYWLSRVFCNACRAHQ